MANVKKKDCLLFLEKVEDKAVRSVKKEFNEQIQVEKDRLIEEKDFGKRIEEMQLDIDNLVDKYLQLRSDMYEDKEVNFNKEDYYDLYNKISIFSTRSQGLRQKMLSECKIVNKEINRLRTARDKKVSAVETQYAQVIKIVKQMPNGKKAAEYLKGLEFDLSSIEAKEKGALTVPIDKKLLFVCGEKS